MPDYDIRDRMCINLAAQIRTYTQPGDSRALPAMLALNEVLDEEPEDVMAPIIAVSYAGMDLGGPTEGTASVVLYVSYYRAQIEAGPEDREVRRAMDRISAAVLSDGTCGGLADGVESYRDERGVFEGPTEQTGLNGGRAEVTYSVPRGAFTVD